MRSCVFAVLLLPFLLSGCISGGPRTIQDPWSRNCTAGSYAVFEGEGISCEEPRACSSDSECAYLDVGELPPRAGACSGGRCTAYCGSGILTECAN